MPRPVARIHLAAEQGLFNFDAITVYEKWINDLADEQRPTGELPGIVPSNTCKQNAIGESIYPG